jgi:hypothetical protein
VTVRATAKGDRGGADASPPQPLLTYIGPQYGASRVLDSLAFDQEFRTNIGLVNFGSREAEFTLAVQKVPGRNVAVSRVRVHPGGMIHASIQSLFPLITKGTDFNVVVETLAPDTYIYASVIEGVHHAARFVGPRIGVR